MPSGHWSLTLLHRCPWSTLTAFCQQRLPEYQESKLGAAQPISMNVGNGSVCNAWCAPAQSERRAVGTSRVRGRMRRETKRAEYVEDAARAWSPRGMTNLTPPVAAPSAFFSSDHPEAQLLSPPLQSNTSDCATQPFEWCSQHQDWRARRRTPTRALSKGPGAHARLRRERHGSNLEIARAITGSNLSVASLPPHNGTEAKRLTQ